LEDGAVKRRTAMRLASMPRPGALTFALDGMRVVTIAGLTLVGGTFYVLLLAAVLWLATSL
jgi:hypothetical protein